MTRRAKVELFEQLRREYEFGAGTVQGVARQFGVHRRQVRQALESSTPPERKPWVRKHPALDPVRPFIEAVLALDKSAPRKQRHTAHRIWVRLCEEMPSHPVAESTVRAYVRKRKWELGLRGLEAHVPQCYGWGEEAQVDWYEAYAQLGGSRVKTQVFAMRSMKSGSAFHCAFLRASQQAFFEGHERAFAYFGGVFRVLRYDNLGSAVAKVLRGHTREEHTRFVEFRSHWRFSAEFCSPGRPQEKGGVEGEAGAFRRNHFVPVPEAPDLESLNRRLLLACVSDQSRQIGDRPCAVGQLLAEERSHLLPLPAEGFDLAETRSSVVDARGCVKTHSSWYSAPLRAGTRAQVRALPSRVEVWHGGARVAVHERAYERGSEVYDLGHYLDTLDKKPGALPRSRPLAQWRARGLWPKSLDELWAVWEGRHGKRDAARAMVDILLLAPQHGWPAIRAAADKALALGCLDESAVGCLLAQSAAPNAPENLSAEELGLLSRYERPMPQIADYDALLGGAQ